MAQEGSINTTGQLDRDTKNMRRFNTAWGVVYVPLSQLEKIGSPEDVTITVTPA